MSLERTDLRPRWPMEDVWTEGHPCVLQDVGPLGPLPKRELCYQNTFVWYIKEGGGIQVIREGIQITEIVRNDPNFDFWSAVLMVLQNTGGHLVVFDLLTVHPFI